MKVIVAGSRKGFTLAEVYHAIDSSKWEITEIVSGTAVGVDQYGEAYARWHSIPVKKFPADWDRFGKSAGYRRNQDMANYADALIAVWDGISKGTKNMIDIMNKLGKPVYVYPGYHNDNG